MWSHQPLARGRVGTTVWLKGVVVPNSPMVRGWWAHRCVLGGDGAPTSPRSGGGSTLASQKGKWNHQPSAVSQLISNVKH